MFTGLIEEVGYVKNIKKTGDGRLLEISSNVVIDGIEIGDSVSINGACQTVTKIQDDSFIVFASTVTCSVTTLGDFKSGSKVNLERPMSISSRFDGHIVQGHVDGKGIIQKINKSSYERQIEINIESEFHKYIANKGSVAVDGISLTVVSLTNKGFIISLIPETLKNTNIIEWQIGGDVNIEVDILAKYVERMLHFRDLKNNEIENIKDKELKKKLLEEGFF